MAGTSAPAAAAVGKLGQAAKAAPFAAGNAGTIRKSAAGDFCLSTMGGASMKETITIPGYSILRELGEGGMASVYLATQHSLEREVALKIMSPLLNSDPGFAARFRREARVVAQLSHASIVPAFEVGEHQSRCYLAMEYLPGGSLKRRLLEGRLDVNQAAGICTAVCGALDLAHRKGFVHRDIKPENILFREDGTPVLTDFGIARALDSGRSMTVAGVLVGTPGYMSPEQVKGLELDGRSDLYSLGVVFYEMLAGTTPFTAQSSLSLALKQVSDVLPSLPPEHALYQDFLDCLTAKDREQRFASGTEVIRALTLISTTAQAARPRVPRPVEEPAEVPPSPAASAFARTLVRPRTPPRPRTPVPAPVVPTPTHSPAKVAARRRVLLVAASTVALAVAVAWMIGGRPSAPPAAAVAPVRIAPVSLPIPAPEMLTPASTIPDPPRLTFADDTSAGTGQVVQTKHHTRQSDERKLAQTRLIEQRLAAIQAAQLQAQGARVQELLIRARFEYAAGALWQPAGANAADDYRQILQMQPQQADAASGARRVADILAAEAARTESAQDIYTTRQLLDRIQMLQPDQPQLADLQARLEQLLITPGSLDARERTRLAQAAQYISQANADLGLDPPDFRAVDAATEQYDKARSTASAAPGLPSLEERLVNAYAVAVRAELDQHDSKRAAKLLAVARRHHWSSPELDQLESAVALSATTASLKEAAAH
jgi:serine/threonine protein kinase